MKMKIVVFILFSLTGCAKQATTFPPPHKVMITGRTLVFDGMITGDSVLEAIRIARASDVPLETLRITSPGGDIPSGIEFGYFVKELGLNVEVSKLCFSACANYVIPAGNKVTIKKDALVGWHGGARQSDALWKQSVPQRYHADLITFLTRIRIKENAFFEHVKVDPNITVYGQTSLKRCQLTKTSDGWYYSISDLNKMGVNNIEVQGELASETEYQGQKIRSCLMPSA